MLWADGKLTKKLPGKSPETLTAQGFPRMAVDEVSDEKGRLEMVLQVNEINLAKSASKTTKNQPFLTGSMELMTGFEPVTSSLPKRMRREDDSGESRL